MAQGYKLVLRSSKPSMKDSPKKYYAVSKSAGKTSLKYLCSMIAQRSTVSSADVKAVLDSLNYVLDSELKEGRIVQMGELGNFRMALRSDGSDTKEEFNKGMIRGNKILFTPGNTLTNTRVAMKYSPIVAEVIEVPVECDKPHEV